MTDVSALDLPLCLYPFADEILGVNVHFGTPPEELVRLVAGTSAISQSRTSQVLDICCGTAEGSIQLARANPRTEFTCVDVTRSLLAAAESKVEGEGLAPRFTFVNEDANHWMRDSETQFDLVMCLAAHYVLGEPSDSLVRLLGRVRPGGWLVVDDCFSSENSGLTIADVSLFKYCDRTIEVRQRLPLEQATSITHFEGLAERMRAVAERIESGARDVEAWISRRRGFLSERDYPEAERVTIMAQLRS